MPQNWNVVRRRHAGPPSAASFRPQPAGEAAGSWTMSSGRVSLSLCWLHCRNAWAPGWSKSIWRLWSVSEGELTRQHSQGNSTPTVKGRHIPAYLHGCSMEKWKNTYKFPASRFVSEGVVYFNVFQKVASVSHGHAVISPCYCSLRCTPRSQWTWSGTHGVGGPADRPAALPGLSHRMDFEGFS